MIIDIILDRKSGVPYNPKELYNHAMHCLDVDGAERIATTLDSGEEKDVKSALRYYIHMNGYDLPIKNYIDSVDWL